MFSLVIAVISIALVVSLAGVTMYYGGSNYESQTSIASSIKFASEGEQIAGSIAVYKSERGSIPSDFELQDLVTAGFLIELPPGEEGGWTIVDNYVVNALTDTTANQNSCWEALKNQGYEFGGGVDVIAISGGRYLPTCDNTSLNQRALCCVNETP